MIVLSKNQTITDYKTTKQRNKIIQVLQNAEGPLTAEEIYLLVKDELPSIVISTIYRNMEALKNIIVKTVYNDGKARYALTKEKHTHNLICLKCKKSIAIEECPLEAVEKNLGEQNSFEILEHKLEIYGHCKDCRLNKE
ncbi:MAG TPA: transcriptional repressor [Desulfotomaculum sp.]|nr:transcriptional repressor [Desulfotomaculum sp.]HBY05239.1 transcriptional repressor [Desulfotomaculum sp.]